MPTYYITMQINIPRKTSIFNHFTYMHTLKGQLTDFTIDRDCSGHRDRIKERKKMLKVNLIPELVYIHNKADIFIRLFRY